MSLYVAYVAIGRICRYMSHMCAYVACLNAQGVLFLCIPPLNRVEHQQVYSSLRAKVRPFRDKEGEMKRGKGDSKAMIKY